MAIYDHIWPYITIYGHICPYITIFGHIWPYIAIYAHIWPYMAISDHIWPYMAIYGHIWPYMTIYAHIWTYMAIYDQHLPMSRSARSQALYDSHIGLQGHDECAQNHTDIDCSDMRHRPLAVPTAMAITMVTGSTAMAYGDGCGHGCGHWLLPMALANANGHCPA